MAFPGEGSVGAFECVSASGHVEDGPDGIWVGGEVAGVAAACSVVVVVVGVGCGAGGEASDGGGFSVDAFVEVVGDELAIGGGEVGSGEFAVVEVDLLEESLVHEPSGFGSGELVGIKRIADLVYGNRQVVFELFVANPEGGDEAVGVGFFSVDAVLFFFEEVDGV